MDKMLVIGLLVRILTHSIIIYYKVFHILLYDCLCFCNTISSILCSNILWLSSYKIINLTDYAVNSYGTKNLVIITIVVRIMIPGNSIACNMYTYVPRSMCVYIC